MKQLEITHNNQDLRGLKVLIDREIPAVLQGSWQKCNLTGKFMVEVEKCEIPLKEVFADSCYIEVKNG
jgi:hypothetical protein